MAQWGKNLPAMKETWVQSLGREDPLEKGIATHSSIPAWRIPWTEEPARLHSKVSQRVRHDRAIIFGFENSQRPVLLIGVVGCFSGRLFYACSRVRNNVILSEAILKKGLTVKYPRSSPLSIMDALKLLHPF